ncbi:phage capsid protein [Oricola sp.]|uniref:phage capsid protein n=1 Tax=Oricola sp. TaxID=1979950 RepID=UPI0025E59AFD|nr:phage capsid protein [Oricola sp.]MCI5075648.1 phage capsid protein [Oricola sp.]
MSQTASNHYVQQWKMTALHEYQSGGFALRNTTTAPEKITGEKMHFPIFGIVEAEEDVKRGDTAKPSNPNDTTVAVDTKKSRAFEEVYEDDLDQMTVNRKQAVSKRSAAALGRVHDKTIVRALRAATQEVGAFTDLMSVNTLVKGKQVLMANDVEVQDGNVFVAVDSVSWTMLIGDKRIANADYVGPDLPFVKGNLAKSWNGMHIFSLSDKTLREKDADTQATCLMWHRSSIGFGYVRELTGTVDWDNRKDCWTHNMRMRIGSKLLLPEGTVKLKAKYVPNDISLPTA